MLAHERVKDKHRISPFHLSQHRRGMRPLKEAPKEEAVVTPDDKVKHASLQTHSKLMVYQASEERKQ